MLELDFNNVLYSVLGPSHSIGEPELFNAIKDNSRICQEILDERKEHKHAFLDLPYQDLADIISFARANAKKYENVVILGIGGSALGARTLLEALKPPFYNFMSAKERKGFPRIFILDNIDSAETKALFQIINPRKTLFNVVSKSGETTETIASLLVTLSVLKKKAGKNYRKNLVITTDKAKGFLRRLAEQEGFVSFNTSDDVQGRYAVLSPVGLLPAALIGIDIKKILKGAAAVDNMAKSAGPQSNPAYLAALINFIYDREKNKNILVMMPYSAQLKGFAEWLRQLYPESLGKRYDRDNKEVYTGPTVMNALGVTDQHSQIQLYNEGPNNKLIVFVEVESVRDRLIMARFNDESSSFLAGRTLHELMQIEKKATEYALVQSRRPNYTIRLKEISEESIGALLYFWQLATAYAGKLYKVNPYNQPGVEAGKRATFGLMGKKGFEKEVADISSAITKNKHWVLKI